MKNIEAVRTIKDNESELRYKNYHLTKKYIMKSPYKGKTGIRRILNAFNYSIAGTVAAFKHEDAFRQEATLILILIPVALYSEVLVFEKVLMISSLLLIIIIELINSAIEATVDRISIKHHDLAKRAKDIGSAAVFFSFINAFVIWLLILTK